MKLIPLTQGQTAKVSDDWYEELNQHNWYARYCVCTRSYYAARNPSRLLGKRKPIYMHRVVANTPDGMETDHIDHDTLNNQVENLRICTSSQNRRNSKKRMSNTSGFKGVVAHGRKWHVRITVGRKNIYIDSYSTREEAAHAYDEAAKKYYGEFAGLNFSK